MTTYQRDGSNETGCTCYWTEAGIRAEGARETREQVAREIEVAHENVKAHGNFVWRGIIGKPNKCSLETCTCLPSAKIARGGK